MSKKPIVQLITQLQRHSAAQPIFTAPAQSLQFCAGTTFCWNYKNHTITYNPSDSHAAIQLLHEYGHALLQHAEYKYDIMLLAMERAAWEEAQRLGPSFGVSINPGFVEAALDTYRDWLHARSLCPSCHATGIQQANSIYMCLACGGQWRTNSATVCQIRRYQI